MTSHPIQHHDHFIEQPPVLQSHTLHNLKSVTSDATKIDYTHDSHNKPPLMKKREINEEDDSFDNDDSFNIDVCLRFLSQK
jgi:hypothetical protein